MTSLSYCELNFCLFLHVPLYFIATLIVAKQGEESNIKARAALEDDLKYLLPESTTTFYLTRCLIFSASLIFQKYL